MFCLDFDIKHLCSGARWQWDLNINSLDILRPIVPSCLSTIIRAYFGRYICFQVRDDPHFLWALSLSLTFFLLFWSWLRSRFSYFRLLLFQLLLFSLASWSVRLLLLHLSKFLLVFFELLPSLSKSLTLGWVFFLMLNLIFFKMLIDLSKLVSHQNSHLQVLLHTGVENPFCRLAQPHRRNQFSFEGN